MKEGVVAGEDQVIKDTETLTILFDVLLYEARSRISNNEKYERLKRYLSRKGFSLVKHGKNKSLDGKIEEVEVRLSHNYKLNRHRFEFCFPKGFKLMECHLFIHNFLKRIHDTPDDYEIGPVASELTVDLKINDIIENFEKAANSIRTKNELFFQFHDQNTRSLIKTYLKNAGNITRIETKTGNFDKAVKSIAEYMNKKDTILDTELQEQLWREVILSLLESLEIKTENTAVYQDLYAASTFQQNQTILHQNQETNENMAEMKEDQITILYQLDQLRHREQKDNEILANQTEILLKYAENQQKWIETQDLLIKNIQLIQEQLAQNYETLFYQNREIMAEISKIETRMKESGIGFKVKHFLKELYRKLKRK